MHKAKAKKNDEFYTQLIDIEKELEHYKEQLKNKVIYCNADTSESNFVKYFKDNFKELKLKALINSSLDGLVEVYDGEKFVNKTINGDFRSDDCIKFLKSADIVITNPPFSLFREYVAQLMEYEKEFLIMGNNNAITYKEIFPLIKENKIWLGHHSNKTMEFQLADHYEKWDRIDDEGNKYGKVPAISWFTNLDLDKKHEEIFLYNDYYGNEENYPKYDNYDAIEVSRVKDIPRDYEGVMGVPITFLTKYNPEQFDVIDLAKRGADFMNMRTKYYTKEEYLNASDLNAAPVLFNEDSSLRNTYPRILIKNKKSKNR